MEDPKDSASKQPVPHVADVEIGVRSQLTKVDDSPYHIFSRRQKWYLVSLVSLAGSFSPLSSNIYFPAINTISLDLGVSTSLIALTITVYMIVQGIAPSLFGALSDTCGRRLTFSILLAIYTGANLGLAFTSNYPMLLVLRGLQAAGSAATISISAGVIADVAAPSERGGFMGTNAGIRMTGQAIGPAIGGALNGTKYAAPIVQKSHRSFEERLRKRHLCPSSLGDSGVHIMEHGDLFDHDGTVADISDPKPVARKLLDRAFKRVEAQYKEEHGLDTVNVKLNRNFPFERARLSLMPHFSVAFILSMALYGPSYEFNDLRRHFAVNLVASLGLQFMVAFTATAIFNINSTMLVDCFPEGSAGATATNSLCRCLLGAAGVSVIQPLIDAVKVRNAFLILTGVVTFFAPHVGSSEMGRNMETGKRTEEGCKVGAMKAG
ncbi:hypothetical protein MRS44_017082 [Fusarium solani]|uniref:uncharacterized protein n=1 Tax=Fusarium solani TaxID=169388 RepID=UPI0032C46856|nr:hypothetical protein MRS44_017082 [Fusarium solani]